ncbi:MAG TPA: O-antigen ligase family protein [Pyrinomonadaceae bacterium]|nr:O-antigen ligase family protein [Pyrinomonadaceae bacterium]
MPQHDAATRADSDTRHAATESDRAAGRHGRDANRRGLALRLAEATAFGGLLLYAVFAPHSIAGAWIALSISILGWLARTVVTRRAGCRRTPLDLPLLLFYAWSILSASLSAEPRISFLKLISVSSFLILYLVRSLLETRRAFAATVAALMIASGAVGALWSIFEVARGRGVVVEEIAPDSLFARDPSLGVAAGDSIWRVEGRRVNSVAEIDEVIRNAPTGAPLRLSLFSHGEQVERVGSTAVPDELKSRASPSGLSGTRRSHRFRASGWTRHYQTFAETLQILAQLSLGFALAYWQRRRALGDAGARLRLLLFAAAFLLLAAGIALTAMRTVLVAFAVGASVLAWRATRGRARLVVATAIVVALALGAFAVWRTRAEGALRLQDESARLRLAVARVALARIPVHPLFGHGMDAVKEHWTEWGFPGQIKIHTHSTPIQLAFDRGLPALLLWLWLLAVFWRTTTRAERHLRADTNDAHAHGLLLGATGALTGFFASSLVNYNFGDAEVALVLWWLMGTTLAVVDKTMNGRLVNGK